MAHSLSAKKRVRQNLKERARNRARKVSIKEAVKAFSTAITAGNVDQAKAELNTAVARMDSISTKGTIHKNAASRKRSRLQKKLNAAAKATKTA